MNRSEIAARIRALFAKTTERGCTEAEAMSAATKAYELIEKHQLKQSEIELEAEGFVKGMAEGCEARRFNVQDCLAWDVEDFCGVKCWKAWDKPRWRYVFFGLRSDVEFANWLLKALERFVWQQADAYALSSGETSYVARRSFCRECCRRIGERLQLEISLRRIRPVVMSDGRSLVVVKSSLVDREFEKLGIRLSTGSCSSFSLGGSDTAAAAGRAAGNRAGFGRPVNGGSGARAISKRGAHGG
jgi:hypothetical protein